MKPRYQVYTLDDHGGGPHEKTHTTESAARRVVESGWSHRARVGEVRELHGEVPVRRWRFDGKKWREYVERDEMLRRIQRAEAEARTDRRYLATVDAVVRALRLLGLSAMRADPESRQFGGYATWEFHRRSDVLSRTVKIAVGVTFPRKLSPETVTWETQSVRANRHGNFDWQPAEKTRGSCLVDDNRVEFPAEIAALMRHHDGNRVDRRAHRRIRGRHGTRGRAGSEFEVNSRFRAVCLKCNAVCSFKPQRGGRYAVCYSCNDRVYVSWLTRNGYMR